MTKQFLVQLQLGEGTRTVADEAEFIQKLRLAATSFAIHHTTGPVPGVKVIRLVDAESWDLSTAAFNASHVEK